MITTYHEDTSTEIGGLWASFRGDQSKRNLEKIGQRLSEISNAIDYRLFETRPRDYIPATNETHAERDELTSLQNRITSLRTTIQLNPNYYRR